jgi:exodeoxyribonuclease VII small subunit
MTKKIETKVNYQTLNNELQELIDWFESTELNIDEALPKYEQALKIIKEMEKYLNTASNRIKKIKGHISE